MNRRLQQIAVTVVAIVAIVVLVLSFLVPSYMLQIGGKASAVDQTAQGEYIKLDVKVSSWLPTFQGSLAGSMGSLPLHPLQTSQEFWTVDGTKRTSVSVTITLDITYKSIKAYTLNVTICKMWFENSSQGIVVDETENSINGANTEGTVSKQYSSGTVSLDGSTSDPFVKAGCQTDGTIYIVYGYFQVQVQGVGLKSGQVLTADTGITSTDPSSWQVQWYTESIGTGSVTTEVTFASWVLIAVPGAIMVAIVVAVLKGGRRRK